MSNKRVIKWHEWDSEAFELAKKLEKPILLDLTAVWCHWCHRMDEDSYSNEEIINLINELYVPIRVDIDQRPDISERYNFGGFPTTAFLTPDGDVFAGATYIPPERFKPILKQVSEQYKANKDEIYEQSKTLRIEEEEMEMEEFKTGKTALDESIISDVLDTIVMSFDDQNGGFGDQPKFPHPEAVDLALLKYNLNPEERGFLKIVTKTLDSMYESGTYDKIEGGFFRYSVSRDWSIPHFEKMLETNAGLLRNYLSGFQVVGDMKYKRAAEEIVNYVNSKLFNVGGGFYGSQDADEEYYELDLEGRKRRDPPFIDKTIFVDWNSMMISSYLDAYTILGEKNYLKRAVESVEFLLKNCYKKGGGMFHYFADGISQVYGLFRDNVYFVKALLDGYEKIFEKRYLNIAKEITDYMVEDFFDENLGGFFDILSDSEALGSLKKRFRSIIENSVAAESLIRLYYLTDNQDFKRIAERALASFTGLYRRYRLFASPYAKAVYLFLKGLVKVDVVGYKDSKDVKEMVFESLRFYEPRKIVRVLDPLEDEDILSFLGYPVSDESVAYVCVQNLCSPPIKAKNQLVSTIKEYARKGANIGSF
ncbi:MAG: thioredoxin domain-containing protein [Candidatus Hodarchaeota archaeon]